MNDLISRSELKKVFGYTDEWYKGRTICELIDNAPTVEVPENEVNCVLTMFGECSYNKTGCSDCEIKDKIRKALKARPHGEYVDISKLRLMKVEECAGHTLEYAMGWKACVEWIKKGGAE